jgi:predicted ATPase
MPRPRTRVATAGRAPFLRGVRLLPDRIPSPDAFPFSIPALRDLDLALTTPVTFLVGENGSGKSTLLEAIAVVCGLPATGGGKNELADRFGVANDHTLASALRPSFSERPRDAFFFRAETLAHFATLLEARRADPDFWGDPYARYGGRSLHTRSHGEAFLATFAGRLGRGLWLLDEPEAALSPQRQLALLALVWDRVEAGETQLVIATHSPLLMTFPGARLLALDETGIHQTTLPETSHYQLTRAILEHPERYWQHLRGARAETDET